MVKQWSPKPPLEVRVLFSVLILILKTMAVTTLKAFIQQSLTLQYADLKSAGVLKKKDEDNYKERSERYTFLGSEFVVYKKSGVVTKILMDCALIPTLA